jgi:hypothetical protein
MEELRWKGMPLPLNTRCAHCFHAVLSHDIGVGPGKPPTLKCARCTACPGFDPEGELKTVGCLPGSGKEISKSYDAAELAKDLGHHLSGAIASAMAGPIAGAVASAVNPLETSFLGRCSFCLHDKKNFKQGTFRHYCREVLSLGVICECEYCYCSCLHNKGTHNKVGCTVTGCKCDISGHWGTIGSCPVALEIDEYLRSFEVPVAR